jgi:glycosyltransferase involved in cell wall biosynthesis
VNGVLPPRRIVINALSSRSGGGVTYINNLLRRMRPETGIEVFVVAAPSQRGLIVPGPFTLIEPEWAGRGVLHRILWERWALPRLLERLRAQVYFAPGGSLVTKPPSGCSAAVAFRNLLPFSPRHRRLYPVGYTRLRLLLLRHLQAWSFSRARLVICVSHHGRRVIEPFLRNSPTRSVVIHHGVSDAFFDEGGEPVAVTGAPPSYVLYVSNLDVYKAQLEVLEAWYRLRLIRNTEEKLVLAGSEYLPYGRRVRRRIAELGLGDEVIVAGPIPHQELPALYRGAKVNVFASRCENCPNTLLEALASGRPVICSSDPPMPEFGGDAVAYFDPTDPERLATLLRDILDDPVRLRRMEVDAKRRAQEFRLDAAVDATWRQLLDLAARAPEGVEQAAISSI